MEFFITLVRQEGWVIPRHEHYMRDRWRGKVLIGDSALQQGRMDLGRSSRLARVVDGVELRDSKPYIGPAPPPLYDVTVIAMTADYIVLSGFERITSPVGGQKDYAQSWVLRWRPH